MTITKVPVHSKIHITKIIAVSLLTLKHETESC